MTTHAIDKPATKRVRKMAREPKAQGGGVARQSSAALDKPSPATQCITPKAPTKTDIILDLLTRAEGATLQQMVDATGWLPHTTRAALTGLKKKGREFTSTKADGVRTYRLISEQQADVSTAATLKSKSEA